MARLDRVAARYAKAIFDSQPGASLKGLQKELESVAELITQNKDLHRAFTTKVISETKLTAVVEDLSKKLKISDPASRVLKVLAGMRRLGALPAIVERLRNLMFEASDIIPLRVEAANSLPSDLKEKLEGRFAKILGKKVAASYSIEPGLIGGVRATAAGRTFDGTISGWLSAVEEQLAEGALR